LVQYVGTVSTETKYCTNRSGYAESADTLKAKPFLFTGDIMNRDFKGVWIPKEVYLDTRLTALEKIILVEIDSLDNGEDGCFASNEYLAEFCQCTKVKVSTAISKLIEFGYLDKAGFDGRRRILKSRLKLSLRQTQTNFKAEINKVDSNNKDNKIVNKDIYSDVPDDIKDLFMEWVDMRKSIKKPVRSKGTVTRAINELNKLSQDTEERRKIIERAIDRNWLGFYPLDDKKPVKTVNKPPEPPKYKQYEPEPEIDAVPMPDEIRKKILSYEKELSV